jgi:hypothetical protein
MTNDQLTGLLYTLLSAVEEQRMVIDKLVEKGVLTLAERKEIAQSYAKMVDARRNAIQQEDDQEPTKPAEPHPHTRRETFERAPSASPFALSSAGDALRPFRTTDSASLAASESVYLLACGCAWVGWEQVSCCPQHSWVEQLELPFHREDSQKP